MIRSSVLESSRCSVRADSNFLLTNKSQANEKATRQQGGLLFSRENSSNGGKKSRQNFLDKILWAEKGGCQAIFGK
jgi:hypothetical protein